ncbi:hypothetical protein [Sporosarcina sp. Te-1]|uniref:hypothetical protein n=1 Tax=Sporosarcina sp. Te-1 TaxID=2818390 RepID=UPI001A9E37CE|nr:hypothetical protein [Sporosarcina sp. Te-1]QTD42612.1 hypothetical protein J3U78_07370 [Sporosarcina sp. Te-1]
MFGRKKKKEESNKTYYALGVFSDGQVDDHQFETWSDELMDAADNVGSSSYIIKEELDQEQLTIINERFPEMDPNRPFFVINEIDYDEIQKEYAKLEQQHKWKKFFNTIPLSDYIDAEDRAVFSPHKIQLCTNDFFEASRFLKERGMEDDKNE